MIEALHSDNYMKSSTGLNQHVMKAENTTTLHMNKKF